MTALRAALWNPIVAKELRSQMRTWRVVAVLVGYLVIVGAVGYVAYTRTLANASDVQSLGQAGRTVFDALAGAVLGFVAILVPGLVGGAISGERERQTLDLLLCTPVRPSRIVLGKLVSSLAFVVLLLAASVPLFSVVFLLGQVNLSEVLVVTLVGLVTAFTLGAVAMFCSAVLRRTTASTVASYLGAVAVGALPLLLGLLMSNPNPSANPFPTVGPNGSVIGGVQLTTPTGPLGGSTTPIVEMFSPGVALVSTLRSTTDSASCVGFGCGGPPGLVVLPSDVLSGGLFSGWREWQVYVLFDTVLGAVVLAASVKIVGGDPPLQGVLRHRTRRGDLE